MEDKDILIMLIKDYVEGNISKVIFQEYYFYIFNFFIDYDKLSEYYYLNFNEIAYLTEFYSEDEEVEYPYFNNCEIFEENIFKIYDRLKD